MMFIPDYGFLIGSVKCCGHCHEVFPATRDYFSTSRQQPTGWSSWCKACDQKKDKRYYSQNREAVLIRAKRWTKNNSKIAKSNRKSWNEENPHKITLWRNNNRHRILSAQRRYNRAKRSTPQGKLVSTVQKSILDGLAGKIKTSRSEVLLGCSFLDFKIHLEKQFSPDMSWENHRSYWHIDHILPKAAFALQPSEEQELCFHWSNQRPLRASENLAKGDKII